ncbi:MAG: peptidase M14 [Flavobacteriia bacterium]|nr:peptidase M14 [Flavobacteriia bacterium]
MTSKEVLQHALKWWNEQSFDDDRWLNHKKKQMLFTKVNYNCNEVGVSREGRSIEEYSWGSGSRGLIAWSQMHGNEATATYAIHDLLLYLQLYTDKSWVQELSKRIHFRIIPMVNPDGAERWSRRTALNIDPNRDAVALQAVETRILMDRIKRSGAEVALNLHDQRNIFHLEKTSDSAVISFLAPSADYERSVNPTRRKAMNWISHLQKSLVEVHKPGAGRYTDEFYPTAFGENVQKLGIPTILIESGASPNDPNRNTARRLNFYLLLQSLFALAYDSATIDQYSKSDYSSIPLNDNKQWDVLIKNVKIGKDAKATVDLGIKYNYFPNISTGKLTFSGVIGDIGDLSHHCALETIDAKGAWFQHGERPPRLDEVATFTLTRGVAEIEFENGVRL